MTDEVFGLDELENASKRKLKETFAKVFSRSKELKQEAEELYNDWYAHKLGAISIIDIICKMAEPREKRIEELEKENAELKSDNDARKFAMAMSGKVEKQLREENKKAEEIIKGLLSFVDSLGNYSGGIFARAEQFINSEVEK